MTVEETEETEVSVEVIAVETAVIQDQKCSAPRVLPVEIPVKCLSNLQTENRSTADLVSKTKKTPLLNSLERVSILQALKSSAAMKNKCSQRPAALVEIDAKFLSNPHQVAQFTVATVWATRTKARMIVDHEMIEVRETIALR